MLSIHIYSRLWCSRTPAWSNPENPELGLCPLPEACGHGNPGSIRPVRSMVGGTHGGVKAATWGDPRQCEGGHAICPVTTVGVLWVPCLEEPRGVEGWDGPQLWDQTGTYRAAGPVLTSSECLKSPGKTPPALQKKKGLPIRHTSLMCKLCLKAQHQKERDRLCKSLSGRHRANALPGCE